MPPSPRSIHIAMEGGVCGDVVIVYVVLHDHAFHMFWEGRYAPSLARGATGHILMTLESPR